MIHAMPSFTAVGDALLDLVLSRGPTSHSAQIRMRAGGTAANASAWAAAAGATARCVGRVGDDAAALALRAALESRGVEARLATDPSRPTGAVALLDGELAVDRGASAALEPSDLAGLLEADALLVSGYLLFHDDSAATGLAALAGARASWRAVDAGGRASRALVARPRSDSERALPRRVGGAEGHGRRARGGDAPARRALPPRLRHTRRCGRDRLARRDARPGRAAHRSSGRCGRCGRRLRGRRARRAHGGCRAVRGPHGRMRAGRTGGCRARRVAAYSLSGGPSVARSARSRARTPSRAITSPAAT